MYNGNKRNYNNAFGGNFRGNRGNFRGNQGYNNFNRFQVNPYQNQFQQQQQQFGGYNPYMQNRNFGGYNQNFNPYSNQGGFHNNRRNRNYNNHHGGRGGNREVQRHQYRGPKMSWDEKTYLGLTKEQYDDFESKGASPAYDSIMKLIKATRNEGEIFMKYDIHFGNRTAFFTIGDLKFQSKLRCSKIFHKNLGENDWQAKHYVAKAICEYYNIDIQPILEGEKEFESEEFVESMKKWDLAAVIDEHFSGVEFSSEEIKPKVEEKVEETEVEEPKEKVSKPEETEDKKEVDDKTEDKPAENGDVEMKDDEKKVDEKQDESTVTAEVKTDEAETKPPPKTEPEPTKIKVIPVFNGTKIFHLCAISESEEKAINMAKWNFLNHKKDDYIKKLETKYNQVSDPEFYKAPEEPFENSELRSEGGEDSVQSEFLKTAAREVFAKHFFEYQFIKLAVQLNINYDYSFEDDEVVVKTEKKVRKSQEEIEADQEKIDLEWEVQQAENAKEKEENPDFKPKSTIKPRVETYKKVTQESTKKIFTCTVNFGDFKNWKGSSENKLDSKTTVLARLADKVEKAFGIIIECPQVDIRWLNKLESQVRNKKPEGWGEEYYGENCKFIIEKERERKEREEARRLKEEAKAEEKRIKEEEEQARKEEEEKIKAEMKEEAGENETKPDEEPKTATADMETDETKTEE